MVAPHAEDRFYEPDWYFGKQTTDITKRFGRQIPTHAYDPQIKNAPIPYHVIPYHDMSDKFRNRVMRQRRHRAPEDTYYGRRATEITSPTRFSQDQPDRSFVPWPPSSSQIGDLRFSRNEYLHPLGKTRPSPMDDYVPILRDKRTGKVINNPSPPPSRKESRRRLLGLPLEGCHSPGSPCRSESPSQPRDADEDEDDENVIQENLDCQHQWESRQRPNEEYRHQGAASEDVGSPMPCPPQQRSGCRNGRPHTAPADTQSPEQTQKPRRRKSYLSSSYGNTALNNQPVGGRPQRAHADEVEERTYANDDQPQSPDSYVSNPPEVARVRHSLGSMSQHAQPVGGRASIMNRVDMDESRTPRSDYTEASNSYHPPAQTSRARVYPPQHHSFSQEPSQRDRSDDPFTQQRFKSNRDDRSTTSSQSGRKTSIPPKHDPNLLPESERGRLHRRSGDRQSSKKDGGGGRR